MESIEILNSQAQGKLTNVFINTKIFPQFKNFSLNEKVGSFQFVGHDDNGNQCWRYMGKHLSRREHQVYDLWEKSNKEISNILGISEESVKSYREKINKKLS